MVAMKSDVIVKRTHGKEKSFEDLKQRTATGAARRYIVVRYRRQGRDWSFQFTRRVTLLSGGAEHYLLRAQGIPAFVGIP
jgi:hypothetical protein